MGGISLASPTEAKDESKIQNVRKMYTVTDCHLCAKTSYDLCQQLHASLCNFSIFVGLFFVIFCPIFGTNCRLHAKNFNKLSSRNSLIKYERQITFSGYNFGSFALLNARVNKICLVQKTRCPIQP